MKANELMIGDWVRLQYKHFIKEELVTKDFQVTEIQKGIETHYIWSKSGNMGVVEHIQPISLTKEILEKNGWYVPQAKIWWECSNVSFWLRQYVDGRFEIMTDEDSDCCFTTIQYVHELQHALRLCGNDKKIVL